MKKFISLALILCLLFSLAIPAAAASTQKVDITYRAIKLVLDGEQFIPCDEKGNTVEPFIMNGTTYLPLRALAQALGLSVAWDGKTSTVTLTSGGEVKTGTGKYEPTNGKQNVEITYRDIKIVLDGVQLTLLNSAGDSVEPFIMNGSTYLPLRIVGEALGLNVSWDSSTSTVGLAQREGDIIEGYWVLSKETSSIGSYRTTTEYKYDAMGNQIQQDFSDNDGYSYRYVNHYDAKGNYTGEDYTCSDGSYRKVEMGDDFFKSEEFTPGFSHYYEYTQYNAKGDITHNLYEDKLSGDMFEQFYTYDAQGRLSDAQYISVSEGYEYSSQEFYSYSGNIRTNIFSDSEGYEETSTTTLSYDAQGRITKEVTKYPGGYTTTIENRYDKYGNEVYSRYDDGSGYWWERECKYDADGAILFESYSDPEYSYSYKYEYDSEGRPSHFEENHPIEGYWNTTDWTYDAEGNLVCKRFEDTANYEEIRISYKNGLMSRVEVEVGGDITVYNITNNDIGLMTKAVSANGIEVYTFEYTLIK